jgi:hypothetical protein
MEPVSSENVWLTWDMDKIFLLKKGPRKRPWHRCGSNVKVKYNEKYSMQL